MSRWWKLPEELGSGVFRETGRFQSLIDLKVPGREGHMVVPSGWLTEAEEPAPKVAVVPPEPGAGSVVVDRDGDAWQRNAVAEPGIGSVVLDRQGIAWQRVNFSTSVGIETRWVSTVMAWPSRTWERLNEIEGVACALVTTEVEEPEPVEPPEPGERTVVVDRLTALIGALDPELAHAQADELLLSLMPPEVAEAYQRLKEASEWWAHA